MTAFDFVLRRRRLAQPAFQFAQIVGQDSLNLKSCDKRSLQWRRAGQIFFLSIQSLHAMQFGNAIQHTCPDDRRIRVKNIRVAFSCLRRPCRKWINRNCFTAWQNSRAEGMCSSQFAEPHCGFATFAIHANQFDFTSRKLLDKVAGRADLDSSTSSGLRELLHPFQWRAVLFQSLDRAIAAGTPVRVGVHKLAGPVAGRNVSHLCGDGGFDTKHVTVPQTAQQHCGIDINRSHLCACRQAGGINPDTAAQIKDVIHLFKTSCFVLGNWPRR